MKSKKVSKNVLIKKNIKELESFIKTLLKSKGYEVKKDGGAHPFRKNGSGTLYTAFAFGALKDGKSWLYHSNFIYVHNLDNDIPWIKEKLEYEFKENITEVMYIIVDPTFDTHLIFKTYEAAHKAWKSHPGTCLLESLVVE